MPGIVRVLIAVDEVDGIREVLDAHDREHGPEDLLAVDPHRGLDLIEQRRAHEEPVLAAGNGDTATVDENRGSLLDT